MKELTIAKSTSRCERGKQQSDKAGRLGNGNSVGCCETGESLLIVGTDGQPFAGVVGVEVAREIDEVTDGDLAVVVQVTFLPCAGTVEVRGEIDEIGNADGAIEIEIADAGEADEDGIAQLRQAE